MERVKEYSKDAMVKMRNWLRDFKDRGKTKFYEIYIDNEKVIDRTDDLKEFWQFKIWLNDTTEKVVVAVYDNPETMIRKSFSFRIESDIRVILKENQYLKKTLADAAEYISILEKKICS